MSFALSALRGGERSSGSDDEAGSSKNRGVQNYRKHKYKKSYFFK